MFTLFNFYQIFTTAISTIIFTLNALIRSAICLFSIFAFIFSDQKLAPSETVLFYSDRDFSTLTWSYTEPRVLTNMHINPIPFDYPADPNASFHYQDIQVGFILAGVLWAVWRLRYWSRMWLPQKQSAQTPCLNWASSACYKNFMAGASHSLHLNLLP